jgi:hypothetical protein
MEIKLKDLEIKLLPCYTIQIMEIKIRDLEIKLLPCYTIIIYIIIDNKNKKITITSYNPSYIG